MLRLLLVVLAALAVAAFAQPVYNATWASINSRPLPSWYDEAKFGLVPNGECRGFD